MKDKSYSYSDLIKLLESFRLSADKDVAISLGRAITELEESIEVKKDLFSQAFDVLEDYGPPFSVMNAWAIASMLEDNISVSQKILAVRGMLKDSNLDSEFLEEWIMFVWNRDQISKDMRSFLAIEFRNDARISLEIKKILQ
ncbi:MAG: hypothetical protein ACTSQE_04080 [Candidatus Heimdallarchaeaceae archaeon]